MGMEDFPYPVMHLTQLHDVVQQALSDQLGDSPASLLVIPPFRHIGRLPGAMPKGSWLHGSPRLPSPEWTLAMTGDRLIAVARQRATSQIEVTAIPFESMFAFEWGTILLYSWLDIVWADPDLRHTRLEYNSVGEPLLRGLLATLQRTILAPLRTHDMANAARIWRNLAPRPCDIAWNGLPFLQTTFNGAPKKTS